MSSMPHLTLMQWNFKDQLQATSRQFVNNGTPETTFYVYDGTGQRVRKITERQNGTRKHERIYVGSFEVFREYDGSGTSVTLERETLHVMDDQQRIALVETRTQGSDGSPAQLIRIQLGNHLGSASLELDHQAQIISYEEYYPYGSTSYQAVRSAAEVSLKRYRYTGMERDDETGMSYHGARYYAPWLGRWLSADPIVSINFYVYSKSNPTRFLDRSGNQPETAVLNQVSMGSFILKGDKTYWSDDKLHAEQMSTPQALLKLGTILGREPSKFEHNLLFAESSGTRSISIIGALAENPSGTNALNRIKRVPIGYLVHEEKADISKFTVSEVIGSHTLFSTKGDMISQRLIKKTNSYLGSEPSFLASLLNPVDLLTGAVFAKLLRRAGTAVGTTLSDDVAEAVARDATLGPRPLAPIIGKAQKTSGRTHAADATRGAEELAAQSDVEVAFLAKSYKTMSGVETTPRRIPDFGSRSVDKRVTSGEVPSPTDILVGKQSAPSSFDKAIINRNLKAMLQLGETSEGLFVIGATPAHSAPLLRVLKRTLKSD